LTGAITDVITDKVSDDSRVPRIVLRNANFDLTNEVCSDISCLGIDATTQLCEHGDEGGSEAETNEEHGDFFDWCVVNTLRFVDIEYETQE
jgi:hypothetical protein